MTGPYVSGTLASTLVLGDVCSQAGANHLEALDGDRRIAWRTLHGMRTMRQAYRRERAWIVSRLNQVARKIAFTAINLGRSIEDVVVLEQKRLVLWQRWARFNELLRRLAAHDTAIEALDAQIAIWRETLINLQSIYDRAYNFERVYRSIVRHRVRYSGFLQVEVSGDLVVVEYGGDDPEKDYQCGRAIFKDGELIEWSPPFWREICQL